MRKYLRIITVVAITVVVVYWEKERLTTYAGLRTEIPAEIDRVSRPIPRTPQALPEPPDALKITPTSMLKPWNPPKPLKIIKRDNRIFFSFGPPVKTSGFPVDKSNCDRHCPPWAASGLAGRLVFTTRPPRYHNSLTIQTISGDTAGTSQKNSEFTCMGIVADHNPSDDAVPDPQGLEMEADNEHALAPSLSPDGRKVLIAVGTEQNNNGLRLFLFNIATKKLKMICDHRIFNTDYSWSPDGRWVVFYEGGQQVGRYSYWPRQLSLLNCDTGQIQVVAQSDSPGLTVTWFKNILYYSDGSPWGVMHPEDLKMQRRIIAQWQSKKYGGTDIYEYSVSTGKSRRVVQNGHLPVVSPDGKYLAFYGQSHPHKVIPGWNNWSSQGADLSIVETNGTGRRILRRGEEPYGQLIWLSDSKQLLTVRPARPSPNFELTVTKWNLGTNRYQTIGQDRVHDFVHQDYSWWPRYKVFGVSADGKSLFYEMDQFGKQDAKGLQTGNNLIRFMDLRSGNVCTIAELSNATDADLRVFNANLLR